MHRDLKLERNRNEAEQNGLTESRWETAAHPQSKPIRDNLPSRTKARLIYRLQGSFTVNSFLVFFPVLVYTKLRI